MLSCLFWYGSRLCFSSLTQYEQLKAHHGAGAGASPVSLSSGEGKVMNVYQIQQRGEAGGGFQEHQIKYDLL